MLTPSSLVGLVASFLALVATPRAAGADQPVRDPERTGPPRSDGAAKLVRPRAPERAQPPMDALALTVEPEAGSPTDLVFRLTNRGGEMVQVFTHRGLLSLELRPVGRGPVSRCAAPPGFLPAEVDPALVSTLAPGQSYAERVDIRYFCWGARADELRAAGALLAGRYGFRGRRASARKWIGQSLDGKARQVASSTPEPVALAAIARSPTDAPAGPLELELGPRHAQSHDGRHVAVSVRLKNRGSLALRLYAHPESFRFEVERGGQVVTCLLPHLERSPLRQSFALVAPGGTVRRSLDLADYCPRETFLHPGVYDVSASFEASHSGATWRLLAFQGLVPSTTIAVRVAAGDLPVYVAEELP